MTAYLLLFGACFLAATVLPFYSEIFLFGLIQQGHPVPLLLAIATLGNTLGSVVNWVLGRYLLHFKDRKWFYFKERDLVKMQSWYQRYGVWSLLLAWMPIGGDALTFIAGTMRVGLGIFLVLVAIGKLVRYIAVYLAADLSIELIQSSARTCTLCLNQIPA